MRGGIGISNKLDYSKDRELSYDGCRLVGVSVGVNYIYISDRKIGKYLICI